MANILNIDTSTHICSVALAVDGNLLFNKEYRLNSQHAAWLGVFVKEAINFTRENLLKIDAIAISGGPGSYTGLRIGVSEAKGLCYGLDIPLIAVSSLRIMADEVFRSGCKADYFCPMIDARRMEVYTAVYDAKLQELQAVSSEIITENLFADYLSAGKVLFFGDGSKKCKPVILSPYALFKEDVYPLAASMIHLSERMFNEGKFEDIAYYEPFYLKEFIATVAKNKVL